MQDELAELGQLCRAAATLANDAGLTVYLSLLQSDAAALTQIAALAANGDWPAGLTALSELEFKRLPAIRAKVEVDITDSPELGLPLSSGLPLLWRIRDTT